MCIRDRISETHQIENDRHGFSGFVIGVSGALDAENIRDMALRIAVFLAELDVYKRQARVFSPSGVST